MSKQILFKKELNEKILKGASIIAEAVSVTIGPRGRTVIIKNKNQKPIITKDGVSVARAIELEDVFENLGAQILKQASEATVASCGDGTSTSMVIANAILTKSQPFLAAGASPVELKKGMDLAVKQIIANIQKISKPITSLEQIEQIATISANGDKAIGKLISVAVDKIGRDGAITIQEGRSSETSLDVTEGFTFDSGLIGNAFINDERRQVCRHEDCLVLVTDRSISTIDEILPILELVARDGRPFVIIAEQIEGQALAALIMNAAKGTMKIAAIKAPKYGEERKNILEDLSTICGASFVSRESGLQFKQLKLTNLGHIKIVESNKLFTTIVSDGLRQQQVESRIDSLKFAMKSATGNHEEQRLQERITRLASGVAIIKVGGATEIEMTEKKHRIEDALEAVNAAQQEGIVPGGGTSLVRVSLELEVSTENDEQRQGVNIIREAIREPFRKIIENMGMNPDICMLKIIESKQDWEYGYDVSTGQLVNLLEIGIIDPFKVLRSALENATSAASTLLTTAVAIVEL